MNWSASPFESLYNSIEGGKIDEELLNTLLPDLESLNLNGDKVKNATSRSKLEADEVLLPDGNVYNLSKNFIYAAIQLSDAMNLDELICCQLIVSSLPDLDALNSISNSIVSLVRNGKVQYFIRRQYILQIVAYIVNCPHSTDKVYQNLTRSNTLTKNVLPSFNAIHTQLSEIKQTINKAQILETYDVLFQQDVKFKRDFLLKEYDTLSQILYGLVERGHFNSKDGILQIIQHTAELDSNDFFVVYYLSSIFHAFRNLDRFSDNDVFALHKHFLQELKTESIYKKPIKVSITFVFLSFFIIWCKEVPESRTKTIDFKTDIDEPMTSAVELGAIEQLLIFSADTSIIERNKSIELYYNMRLLLERHIPRLIPKQLIDNEAAYIDNTTVGNIMTNPIMRNGNINTNHTTGTGNDNLLSKTKYQFHEIQMSQATNDLFASTFHSVLQTIINDCAFLLTKIKDAEEDSLMSGEDLNLDDICVKADLERFFLAIHYFYAARPEYSEEFWNDKESNTYGFIEWASKSKDILIRSCFYLMIASLSFGSKNVLDVFHYFGENNSVSWTLIATCIKDYVIKISGLGNVIQERQRLQDTSEINNAEVALEEGLNEETIVFLSSLFTLISSVASEVDEDIKQNLSNLFTDVLFEFSKLETPLVGACFKTLSYLVPKETSARSKFWFSLDSLIFKSYSLTSSSESYRAAFGSFLTNFTEVQGFLHLLDKLMLINDGSQNSEFLKFGTLQYPSKLGQSYRKAGIWPYFDYILNDVFYPSTRIENEHKRRTIYKPILNIIKSALFSFDYSVILNSSPAGADLDKLVVSENFSTYVQETSAPAMFNYLFTDKVYKPILNIITFGIDQLSIDLEGGDDQLHLIELAVTILDTILEYQNTYIEEFVPIFKKQRKDVFFAPKDVGLHGLRNFYDALFFNLTTIAHLGLYVGVEHHELAARSLSVLDKLTMSSNAALPEYSIDEKVLTILDSVDESSRIKDAFMTQIDTSISSGYNLELKIKILKYLSSRLSYSSDKVTVSHLLLGFQVSNVISDGPNLSTFISSGVSLLDSVTTLLVSSLNLLTRRTIDFAPMRLACLSIEILLKLCRNPMTSDIVFSHLEKMELFSCLIKLDPDVTKYTLFNGRIFDDKASMNGKAFLNSKSMGSLLSFLCYKTYVIQLLSQFIHRVSFTGTESQVASYVSKLISNTIYSAKIFSFFDTLNYPRISMEKESSDLVNAFSDLTINLATITFKDVCDDEVFDFSSVESLAKLFIESRVPPQSTSMILSQTAPDPRKKFLEDSEKELHLVKKNVTGLLYNKLSEEYQLSILHSWVQLVQIIVTDGKLDSVSRSKFILEVFTAVVPKLNDYVEFDISFAEELVSLVVFLYEVYDKDRLLIGQQEELDFRLSDIFKLCIHGILSPMTSVPLRSDFYTLTNQYLVRVLKDKHVAKGVLQTLRMSCEQFIQIVCNDAIYGQETNRITSILLLDSLVQIGSITPENFILDSLTKSAQLHLIIRSLKNIDNMLDSAPYQISIDDLLYELTAFKTTVFFLIRIAETRTGAKALVENKLFQVIESCSFLRIDPDLGMNLVFDEVQINNSSVAKINISLDNHLVLEDASNCVSLFELISPIFQLLCCVLVSSGDQNKNVILSTKKLLIAFKKLLIGIFKRDALSEAEIHDNKGFSSDSLKLLVKLSVILCTLTGYRGEDNNISF
ncbi:similar to Saccharomyces cerevisiae YJL039C NUP192 Essential structural subunit of the nuclear pore complex (NPC) [Maudiozyma saulgeensis]|uniref:Similar to Saccharomyces cerevisiae YJL039C NUP192 Essential structural subunit of the nuclear pore complex (NPC) n=1 Tax=Maudiozyma saulgeensis TaxID=1789683 RepID=A0A1X7R584_9SACH|nr:similar to Saccharomyces cerevisiae YJL039C NUP192 Essential structural subunit of the nuclear pore complex (NPC) [Kazachstania saulgeensis]